MGARRRKRFGRPGVVEFGVVGFVVVALAACGVDPGPTAEPSQLGSAERAAVGDPPATATARATDIVTRGALAPLERVEPRRTPSADTLATDATRRPTVEQLDQPAIWPAPDVVFDTPEEAAADFVSSVLISEGDPVLGEFQQGDARSGEIAVLFAGEAGDLDPPIESGILSLRRIGPTDGWYVIAASSDGVVIDTPSALAEVPAGSLTVAGEGRGFEGTLVVSAFPPGDNDAELDQQVGAGGALDELEPYSVELDLTGAADGDVVVILVHGDSGLGSDPSTFSAIPVVVAPATLPPSK